MGGVVSYHTFGLMWVLENGSDFGRTAGAENNL